MMHRIKRIGVYQTAKVVGIIYFFVTAVFMIPIGLLGLLFNISLVSNMGGMELVIFIVGPFIYGILGFFGTALACWIYNLVAGSMGGIELKLENVDTPSEDEPTS